ncbi:1994_t:CDS:2, partial [Cetraspora pellucida]
MALEDCAGSNVNEIWESKKAFFNIRLIPSHWFSEEGLTMFDNDQESLIQIIQNKNKLPTGTFQILERIRGQEVNSRVAVELESKKILLQCQNTYEPSVQELDQRTNDLKISDPLQHKGKGRPANKRYLSANENHDIKNIGSNYQDDETLESGSIKKN